ncbi:hypothetical protein GCM10009850_092210 [Nonomuraea monospora]|uniref:Uncharacterized protein n=1 Tax=Nonomuraea monospora TaxID=568818 RepID=A0ABN3CW78_9ACTN
MFGSMRTCSCTTVLSFMGDNSRAWPRRALAEFGPPVRVGALPRAVVPREGGGSARGGPHEEWPPMRGASREGSPVRGDALWGVTPCGGGLPWGVAPVRGGVP